MDEVGIQIGGVRDVFADIVCGLLAAGRRGTSVAIVHAKKACPGHFGSRRQQVIGAPRAPSFLLRREVCSIHRVMGNN